MKDKSFLNIQEVSEKGKQYLKCKAVQNAQ